MEWSSVFDGEQYTAAEVIEKLSSLKLADLSAGEYVHKDKLDKAIASRKAAEDTLATYQQQLDGDAGLKQQVADLTAQLDAAKSQAATASAALTRTQRIEQALKVTRDPKLAKLAVLEAEAIVSEDLDFTEALQQVVDNDPEYIRQPTSSVSTGTETTGTAPIATDPLRAALDAALGTT